MDNQRVIFNTDPQQRGGGIVVGSSGRFNEYLIPTDAVQSQYQLGDILPRPQSTQLRRGVKISPEEATKVYGRIMEDFDDEAEMEKLRREVRALQRENREFARRIDTLNAINQIQNTDQRLRRLRQLQAQNLAYNRQYHSDDLVDASNTGGL